MSKGREMDWWRIALSGLAALSLQAQPVLRLATGITPAQDIFSRVQASFELASGIRLVLDDARGPEAWQKLDAGTVDAAAAGMSWEDWQGTLRAKGLRLPKPGQVTAVQVGTDQIQVLTSMDILFLDLGKEDLQAIFTGKVGNWKRLGGPDAPITLLIHPAQEATNAQFAARILDGQPLAPGTWTAPLATTMEEAVASTPHAIGFAPQAAQSSVRVNSPLGPEMSRPITLIYKGAKPSKAVRKLLDFLSSDTGRSLVVH